MMAIWKASICSTPYTPKHLAYGMNGQDLPVPHGAPVRLKVETQIGYKSVKYLQRIVVTNEFVDTGDSGWAWYVGI